MFLAFPLNGKPDWRNPPWLTILLIVVNCIIYFGPQGTEQDAMRAAVDYYSRSELPKLELPRYVDYLRHSNDGRRQALAVKLDEALRHKQPARVLTFMEWDAAFQAELHAGRIVQAKEPEYERWHEQRARFDQLKGPAFTARWALNPADWQPITLVTAAFLHGSAAHLIGNMVFLFAFGYTVELALGRGRYLAFYLLAGVAGEAGDLLMRWGSPVIGLGASGAISGLMAMYAMLYGRRRIRFFYQLLFYFDYVKAPAIILLPAWIAHEFIQQTLNPEDGVAHMAHAGGLIAGALLLGWHKYRHPETKVPVADEAVTDAYAEEKAKAEALVKTMQLTSARDIYSRLVKLRPTDGDAVARYFNLAKLTPADDHFHRAARYVFAQEANDAPTEAMVHKAFLAYWEMAKPRPLLTPEQMARLAIRFARAGELVDAERLGLLLLRQDPTHQALPSVLLGLVRAQLQRNGRERAAEHGRTLMTRYSGSAEARIAADLLKPA
jgi:membrane associated rhomboid family serine protease